jgi:hypothetical protein
VPPDDDQDDARKSPYSLDSESPDPGGPPPNAVTVQRRLREAAGMLLRGDVAGVDKLVFLVGDREPAPLRELSHLRQEQVRHAFVKPERWRDTLAAASGRQLIVLTGEPGRGRTTAGVSWLQTTETGPIYQLDRHTDLRRFATWLAADGPSGGFVLTDPVDALDGLDQIAAALDKRDARMVITHPSGGGDHIVGLGAAPPPAAILERHLRWRLGTDAERALADPAIRELAAEDPTAADPADLALAIAQQYDGGPLDADRLRHRQTGHDDVAVWFAGLPDVRTRSLAIALAALNGLSYESVLRAAARLTELLDGPPQVVAPASPMLQPPWHDPFDRARPDRLRVLRARTRQVTVQGTFGRTPTEIVEYADEGRPGALLEHVWHSYGMHRPLLAWLAEVAHDADTDVRIWAGTTLGLYATYAYDLVWTSVLQRMTSAESRTTRDVVAYALRVPAAEARTMPLVRRVSNRLHGNAGQPLGQACGARVRALGFGPNGIEAVLEKLDRLAILDDYRIATAIGDSLGDLMAQDVDTRAPIVLGHLAGWFEDRRRNRTAQWVFHEMANALRTDIDYPKTDAARPSYVTWPSLLLFADQRPELRPLLIGMLGRVLNTGEFPGRVNDAMDNWASWAESYDDVLLAFVRLLTAVAALSPRTRTLVLRHTARWLHVEELFPLPVTAHAVEKALNARNDAP